MKPKVKKRKNPRTWKVLVQGRDSADDFVVKVKAHSRDEAEMNAADAHKGRWVRVIP